MSEGTSLDHVAGERLQKVLARAGIASRRASEALMLRGRVTVNDQVVRELGTRVHPDDVICVDGRRVIERDQKRYLVVNKPLGYVTTARDPEGRPTVMRLVPEGRRLFPVGRLDVESEGLLLFTDDGDLTFRMTHPRFGIDKEYHTLVGGELTNEMLRQLREGVVLDGRRTAPASVDVVARNSDGTWLKFVIHEGRNRQIRRMTEAVGLSVIRLIRTRVGPLRLGDLPSGTFRELTAQELRRLTKVLALGQAPLTIAIDGPAGSGKSALAVHLAKKFNLLYLDTGALYRAVALLAMLRGVDQQDEESLSRLVKDEPITIVPTRTRGGLGYAVLADGRDVTNELYTSEVGAIVSIVSAFPMVRAALLMKQRQIAAQARAVVVGRDIGTVVLPDAPIKIYLEASEQVRARRRLAQLRERGTIGRFDEVLAEIRLRDRLDSERETSPLAEAPDAIVLNTDQMSVEQEAATVGKLIVDYENGHS